MIIHYRYNFFVFIIVCTINILITQIECKSNAVEKTSRSPLTLILGSIGLFFLFLCCGAILKNICPNDEGLSVLELDDIRIERLDRIETSIYKKIGGLKDKLAFHRMKKTAIETNKDITSMVRDKIDAFNARGQGIYGVAAWEGDREGGWTQEGDGPLPLRDVLSLPDDEIRKIQIQARNIVTERKAKEEKDLWNMWNELRADQDSNQVPDNTGAGAEGQGEGEVDVVTGRRAGTGAAGSRGTSKHKINVTSINAPLDDRFVSTSKPPSRVPSLNVNTVKFPPKHVQVPARGPPVSYNYPMDVSSNMNSNFNSYSRHTLDTTVRNVM